MTLYANSFLMTMIPQIKGIENKEVAQFVNNIVEQNSSDVTVDSGVQMWGGESFCQRAAQWGKRIHLLFVVNRITTQYKDRRTVYLALDSSKQDPRVLKQYQQKENLLNFISNDQLIGQRPSIWWTRRHDIDLVLGTQKWGYGNYQVMREDPKLSFMKLNKNDSYYMFPPAETVTRRLKKLVQIISRIDGEFGFENQMKPSEHSGFNSEEKQNLVNVISDIGIPIQIEDNNKYDWQFLRNKVSAQMNRLLQQSDQKVEKIVNYIQLECQKLIQEYYSALSKNNIEKSSYDKDNEFRVLKAKRLRLDQISEPLFFKTDDEDDFSIDIYTAFVINKRISLFNTLRRHILAKQSKIFEENVDDLSSALQEQKESDDSFLPDYWTVGIHDRGLLNAVSEKGIKFLKQVRHTEEYGLMACNVNSKKLLRRVEDLCFYFKTLPKKAQDNTCSGYNDYSEKESNIKASTLNIINRPNQKFKVNIEKNEDGTVKYPIIINQSLKILNLGYIEYEKPDYHSSRNIFPVGYKSIRNHQSIYSVGGRADYICEILDGGAKPLYKVTPLEEPDKPIVRDSTSGCWLEIVKRIELLQQMRKGKATISGPDRYGLQELPVMQLIQQMPNADRCSKYIFR